ncbi:subtilisin-like protease SBT5.3 isoform X2 [Mangifera indica]|uniref:subtilisin-like protease SBT5.3 isoform X2 n=1 Tax=Mangifera indica TaxID=29780 RepID=UPI001CFB4EEA|nr:subtilisin-like protease SBT5.3 isoform X2 [Mangifera indica]
MTTQNGPSPGPNSDQRAAPIGRGISWVSPKPGLGLLKKAMSLLDCSTQEFGRNLSFIDHRFAVPPSKSKGICQGTNFICESKIIGARYYKSINYYGSNDFQSPRETEGHGSHTSSTAAGREVPNASYHGQAYGTTRGGVPNSGIAMFKVISTQWMQYDANETNHRKLIPLKQWYNDTNQRMITGNNSSACSST